MRCVRCADDRAGRQRAEGAGHDPAKPYADYPWFWYSSMATGCHSIHSSSVRDLIQLEGTKIDAAQTNIDLFQKETEARIKFLEQARSSLHESFKSLQTLETKHRFVLASFRNVTNKKGESAYAAAYLMSLIYMADAQGLEKAVWDQFEEDFCGLRDTANALNDSWKHTATLHAQIHALRQDNRLWLPSILNSSARSWITLPADPSRSWES